MAFRENGLIVKNGAQVGERQPMQDTPVLVDPATRPTAVTNMATDHNTEIKLINGEQGAWKRDNLSTNVEGSGSEGTIIEVVTTANKAFELGNILLRIRPR